MGNTTPAAIRSARPQIEPIPGLEDWSAVVTPEGRQLQTVGHHFEGSGPLPAAMREKMDRRNVCLGCHMEIPKQSLAVSLLHHIAKATGQTPVTREEHESLVSKILLSSAWVQAGGLVGGGGLLVLLLGYFGVRRRKRERAS